MIFSLLLSWVLNWCFPESETVFSFDSTHLQAQSYNSVKFSAESASGNKCQDPWQPQA